MTHTDLPPDAGGRWRIHYADGSMVCGDTPAEWMAAPSGGVQAVVLMVPGPLRWHIDGRNVVDRQLWTGDDEYDPFGWGVKYGSLISASAYADILGQAAHGCG